MIQTLQLKLANGKGYDRLPPERPTACAQEDTTTLRFYTGKAVNGSDGKELIL